MIRTDIGNLSPSVRANEGDRRLDQWFTPGWAAEALVEQFFPGLGAGDYVLDLGCGRGAFLGAIPADAEALGVEIDHAAAAFARAATGRQVIVGDLLTVPIPGSPNTILGNPPWSVVPVEDFLARADRLLPRNGRVGLILPCYTFQTPSRVLPIADVWSIAVSMIPRNLFPGFDKPLCFSVFTKDRRRLLQGMALYAEAEAVRRLAKAYSEALAQAPRSPWAAAVAGALRRLGGRASLASIYAEVGGRRPSDNPWWREKVRQTLQRHFVRLGEGLYALPALGAAA